METCLLWLNLFADLLCLLVLALRSKSSLAAENLFLRKQLAFHQERRITPRRTSHPTRLTLLWLSRWFNWRSALTVVTPKTFISGNRPLFYNVTLTKNSRRPISKRVALVKPDSRRARVGL